MKWPLTGLHTVSSVANNTALGRQNSKACPEVGQKPARLCCIQGSLKKPGTKRGRLVERIGGQLYEMAGRKCHQKGWSPLAGTFGSVSDNPWQCSWTFTYVRTTKAHCITADAKQPAGLCYCQSGRLALRGGRCPWGPRVARGLLWRLAFFNSGGSFSFGSFWPNKRGPPPLEGDTSYSHVNFASLPAGISKKTDLAPRSCLSHRSLFALSVSTSRGCPSPSGKQWHPDPALPGTEPSRDLVTTTQL